MRKSRISPSAIRTFVLVLAFSILSLGVGYNFGRKNIPLEVKTPAGNVSIFDTVPTQQPDVDMSLFWEVWRRLEVGYVDKTKLDHQKMLYGAISGMTSALGDPYTVFLPPEANKEVKDSLNGTFEGIGAQLGAKDSRVVVVAPLKGAPAEKAGILAGDIIVKVNGEEALSLSVPQAVEKIRGPKGSNVTLTVLHEGQQETVDIVITRDTISIPSVESEFKEQTTAQGGDAKDPYADVAIIKLYQFGDNTSEEWEKEVTKIIAKCGSKIEKCKGLVFDVRNNPGGYLLGAVYVASEFLEDGLVVTQEHSSGKKEEYVVNRKGRMLDVPVVVIVNKGSASAAEIVSGALQKRGRAQVVGEQSFGKGSVQEAQELPGGAGLHVTTAKWLLPDGTWINGTGITPDIVVADDPATADIDEQLEKAIELLRTGSQ